MRNRIGALTILDVVACGIENGGHDGATGAVSAEMRELSTRAPKTA